MSYIGNQPTSVAFLTDQFSGTGSQTAFTLSAAPANTASILVAVSGVLQDPSTYSVAGTTLTFSAAPPSGTGNISVRYLGIPASNITTTAYSTRTDFTATAGQTTFTVPSYTVNFIQVYRNGVLLGTADFTATSGTTVVLSTGATAGDLVTTISFYVSSVLGAIPAASGAVTNAYLGAISTFTTPTSKTVTLPDVTGTVMVSGNMPAFSYAMTTQNISTSTSTLVTWNTKNFDTANSFNATSGTVGTAPAWSFNPQVAGYYQVNMQVITGGSNYFSIGSGAIYKNGSIYRSSASNFNGGTGLMNYSLASLGDVIYMNGSTDYLQVYAYSTATSAQVIGGNGFAAGGPASLFSAVLVRTA